MKTRILVAVALLGAGLCWAQSMPGSKSDQDSIVQMEKNLWEAWKNNNMEVFQKSIADDAVGVGMTGAQPKSQFIEEMKTANCNVSSYSLEETKVTWVDKNTGLLTYKANQDATCGERKAPSPVWATSLWVKKGGKWQAMFHQETPSQEAMQMMTSKSQ